VNSHPDTLNAIMPRTARASQGGYCYHAINRGNGRSTVFRKPQDFAAFAAKKRGHSRMALTEAEKIAESGVATRAPRDGVSL